jgi:cellulose synthase/poly-beta-1,6-N-acetylglucosamine synthase-like glycosyltransferase
MVQQATLGQQPHTTGTSPDNVAAVPRDVALSLVHSARPQVDIVIPVYNEEADLEPSVTRLHRYLSAELPFSFRITVADNASTDRTWAQWVESHFTSETLNGVTVYNLSGR